MKKLTYSLVASEQGMKKECGSFSIENGVISGPQTYMTERGNAKLEGIESGTDTVFNASLLHSPDVETGILVALQTDYAAWRGGKEFQRWLR